MKIMKNIITIGSKDREAALQITPEQAYEHVKTGVWNLEIFKAWLDHVISDAESTALEYQHL